MGLWITLRKKKEKSFFRDNLLNMISNQKELDGNSLILASGYFSEYESSPYSILGDDLLRTIQENENIKGVTVIGAMGLGQKPIKTFNTFCTRLRQGLVGRTITKRRPENNKWHAKIAMKLRSDENGITPVCAIIGSSNLTRSSYGKNPPPQNVKPLPHFNYECDVLIFINDGFTNHLDLKTAPEKIFPEITKRENGSIYFPEIRDFSPPESEQLLHLWKEILESTFVVEE
jgi:hypothetical protein